VTEPWSHAERVIYEALDGRVAALPASALATDLCDRDTARLICDALIAAGLLQSGNVAAPGGVRPHMPMTAGELARKEASEREYLGSGPVPRLEGDDIIMDRRYRRP